MRHPEDSTLWRISAFERMREQTGHSGFAALTPHTVLPTTLTAELDQLPRVARQQQLLEVTAACVRHRENALLLVRHRGLIWPLTLFPGNDLYHTRRPLVESLAQDQRDLEFVALEPPGLRPPGHHMHERIAAPDDYHPLPQLTWALALHVPHAALLQDIAGRAAYRLSADFNPQRATLPGALTPALRRLRTEIAPLNEIATWPGMDRERAIRVLNGAYLQGGLMVLRTHHAASDADAPAGRWKGLRGRLR